MSKSLFYAGLMLVSFAICPMAELSSATFAEEPVTTKILQGVNPDEAAIRAATAAFTKSFNAGDAKSIAAQWTEDGDYVNSEGKRYVGRETIQKEYEAFFKQIPGVQIQIKIDSVKMLSADSAIQEGTSMLGSADAPSPVSSHFMTVYVKQNNQWLIASARDVRVEVASTEVNIADFEKLIGSWNCRNDATRVQTTCRWVADKKFIERSFTVSENGAVTQSGTQIIGWNPMEQQITSWLFDSTGGHDFATWTPTENGWMSQSNGVTGDGTPTSATNMLTHVDDNTMSWKSVNRTIGEQSLADSGELVLKRGSTTSK